jgi:hypothetical protein
VFHCSAVALADGRMFVCSLRVVAGSHPARPIWHQLSVVIVYGGSARQPRGADNAAGDVLGAPVEVTTGTILWCGVHWGGYVSSGQSHSSPTQSGSWNQTENEYVSQTSINRKYHKRSFPLTLSV